MALPGRIVLTPRGDVWPRRLVAAGIFALQAFGLLALLGTGAAALWATVSGGSYGPLLIVLAVGAAMAAVAVGSARAPSRQPAPLAGTA